MAEVKYLSDDGLLYLWQKIKERITSSTVTKTSELTNDSNFQTGTQVNNAISTAIAGITSFNFEIVDTLPENGIKGTIYLVAHESLTNNGYDEYIYVNGSWELIGNTNVDLSGYVQFTDLQEITNAEIDAIFAE